MALTGTLASAKKKAPASVCALCGRGSLGWLSREEPPCHWTRRILLDPAGARKGHAKGLPRGVEPRPRRAPIAVESAGTNRQSVNWSSG